MSYANHYTGAITITPPLNRRQVIEVHNGHHISLTDVALRITEEETESADGEFITIRTSADAIIPLDIHYTGYNLASDIQSVIDHFPDHTFSSHIEVQWDADFQETLPARYVIQNRKVVQVRPRLVWPDEDDEDTRSAAEACADYGNEEGPRGIRQLYARFEERIAALNSREGKSDE